MKIHFRTLALASLLMLPLAGLPAHAQQAEGLQQRMSAADFKAAGLDKLSPQELANLDAWLAAHPVVKTRVVSSSGKPVFYPEGHERSAVNAHLTGEFTGWHGQNLITLDNGQQWKQVGDDSVTCSSSNRPAAKVKPSLFGNWLMFVEGCNGQVHVKRVR